MTGFPPTPTHGLEIASMVEAFSSVAEARSAIYVSSPLTTGPRAFEWHRQTGSHVDQEAFLLEVIEPNRREAASFVRLLRERTEAAVVIDPTAMGDLPEWEQDDYRYFWGNVIERYCARVIFRNGWQFSSGCSYEYLIARRAGAEILAEDGGQLTAEISHRLLGEAVTEIENRGASAEFLRSVLGALEQSVESVWQP